MDMNKLLEANSTDEFKVTKFLFSWYDYTLFGLMLALSTFIGIYFGCFGKKQSTADEYLFGGRQMRALPIAMSLVASQVSGIALLAIPADIYLFGTHYWLSCFGIVWGCAVTCYIYLPVFYKLQITSTYEYLKLRFDTRVRVFASFIFAISIILYLPIVIYAPALALEQVTDINIHFITPIICAICIFYTTIGGLKAVVWTDMLQFSVTIGAMAAVFILGIISAGGFVNIFKKAAEGERFDIDFDWDPTKRDTFWAVMIGWPFLTIGHLAIHQSCVQKFLSVPSLKDAKITAILFVIGIIIVKSVCAITGLIMYSKYATCDPLTTGLIRKPDQLLPFYVMDVASSIPGLTGLFIAGIFGAALSTLSAVMNCLAGTIYEDFLSRFMPKDITQNSVSNILKVIVLIIGVVSTCLVYVVQHLGGLLPIAISFASVSCGPLLGVFTLGILFPKANAKGAFWGGLSSLIILSTIFFGAQYYKANGIGTYQPKPFTTETCEFNFVPKNSTILDKPVEILYVFRITHYYYTLIGVSIVLIIGYIISLITRDEKEEKEISIDLFAPIVQRFLRKSTKTMNYYSVDKALNLLSLNNDKENTLK